MAKKNLRAQMDAARAAAAFIGAAQEEAAEAPKAKDGKAAEPAAPAPAEEAAPAEGEGIAEAPAPEMGKGTAHEAILDDFFAPREFEPALEATAPPARSRARAKAAPEPEEAAPGRAARPQGADAVPAVKPKATRGRPRKRKAVAEAPAEELEGGARMTAQVLVPMTAEQREHADLLAQVMKITRAEVMRQALDEYWDNHKAELQAAVAAYEALIRKLMS